MLPFSVQWKNVMIDHMFFVRTSCTLPDFTETAVMLEKAFIEVDVASEEFLNLVQEHNIFFDEFINEQKTAMIGPIFPAEAKHMRREGKHIFNLTDGTLTKDDIMVFWKTHTEEAATVFAKLTDPSEKITEEYLKSIVTNLPLEDHDDRKYMNKLVQSMNFFDDVTLPLRDYAALSILSARRVEHERVETQIGLEELAKL